jgi:hypothetical protein
MLILAAIGLALAAASLGPACFAQNQKEKSDDTKPVQVKGKVVDRQGNPLSNVEVSIDGPKAPGPKKTGHDGAFTFEVPPGDYKITAKSGNKSASMSAKVTKSMDLAELVLNTEQ